MKESYTYNPDLDDFGDIQDPIYDSDFPRDLFLIDDVIQDMALAYGDVDMVLTANQSHLYIADSLFRAVSLVNEPSLQSTELVTACAEYVSNRFCAGELVVSIPPANLFNDLAMVTTKLVPPETAELLATPAGAAEVIAKSFFHLEKGADLPCEEKSFKQWKTLACVAMGILGAKE